MDGIDDSTQENNNKGVVFNLKGANWQFILLYSHFDLDFCYNGFIILQ